MMVPVADEEFLNSLKVEFDFGVQLQPPLQTEQIPECITGDNHLTTRYMLLDHAPNLVDLEESSQFHFGIEQILFEHAAPGSSEPIGHGNPKTHFGTVPYRRWNQIIERFSKQ